MRKLNQQLLNNVLICDYQAVKENLLQGANPNIQDETGACLLDLAIDEKDVILFDLLTKYGATFLSKDNTQREVVVADLSTVKESLKNVVDEEKHQEIDVFFIEKRREVIEYLKAGGNINKENDTASLLEVVASNPNFNESFVRFLIKMGADMEEENLLNYVARPELIRMLMAQGVDCLKPDKKGKSILDYQVLCASPGSCYGTYVKGPYIAVIREIEEHLKKKGIAVPQIDLPTDPQHYESLPRAVFRADKKAVETLLAQEDVDINQTRSFYNDTALMFAAEFNDRVLLKTLLEKNADVNLQDKEGQTALMHAVKNYFIVGLKILLAHGADASLKDNNGYTALMHAIKMEDYRAVVAFYRAGFSLTNEDKYPLRDCLFASLMGKVLKQLEKETKQKENSASRKTFIVQKLHERE